MSNLYSTKDIDRVTCMNLLIRFDPCARYIGIAFFLLVVWGIDLGDQHGYFLSHLLFGVWSELSSVEILSTRMYRRGFCLYRNRLSEMTCTFGDTNGWIRSHQSSTRVHELLFRRKCLGRALQQCPYFSPLLS